MISALLEILLSLSAHAVVPLAAIRASAPILPAATAFGDSKSEFDAVWSDAAVSECAARNPLHALSLSFDAQGLRISQERGEGTSVDCAFTAARIQRGARAIELPAAEVCFEGQRVELDRGIVVEWYVNDAFGLEQGFTFAERPLNAGVSESDSHLEIHVDVHGDLAPSLDARGSGVELCASDGSLALSLGVLHAFDALGREQPAHFEVRGRTIVLSVDDRNAQYPLIVDPLFISAQTKIVAPDAQSLDFFGAALATTGDTLLVGSYGDNGPSGSNQGGAYVFVREGAAWVLQAKLVASDATAEDFFGISVALDGDTAIVGAFAYSGNQGAGQGAAYVFERTGTTWVEHARLTGSDSQAGDAFGIAVAVQGDRAVVGAYRHDGVAGADQGQAYVFARAGGNWTEFARLVPQSAAADSLFGSAIAVDGTRVIVSAPFHDGPTAPDQGTAYVFVEGGTGYAEEARLIASDGAETDLFGVSVDLQGTTAVIGSYLRDAEVPDQGAVYVFERGASSWTQTAVLVAADPIETDLLGSSVALDGTILVAGAEGADGAGGGDDGAAYVFVKNGNTWSEQGRLAPTSPQSSDSFGKTVDVRNGTIAGGAYFDSHPGGLSQGSVTMFDVLVTPGFPYCFGDGADPLVTAACPCANAGNEGRGCRASNFALGGARLSATGQSQPNTVVFTVTGIPNRSLCAFMRGTVNIQAGFVFGDGVRCVAGTTLLFGHQRAGEGANEPHSARTGTPTVPPGGTRFYQVLYRNSNPTFCTPEQFNMSSGFRIVW